ncbi:hypothetical protein Trydic_g1192 [Trypoxylus dichotomus]
MTSPPDVRQLQIQPVIRHICKRGQVDVIDTDPSKAFDLICTGKTYLRACKPWSLASVYRRSAKHCCYCLPEADDGLLII